MQKVVIDSDIIIDHFRKGSDTFNQLVRESIENKTKVYLPAIVYTEINSGQDSKYAQGLSQIEKLPQIFEFVPANQEISQKAGSLIRDNQQLGIADAIIAATTLSLKAKLATRNKKDYQGLEELKFFKGINLPPLLSGYVK